MSFSIGGGGFGGGSPYGSGLSFGGTAPIGTSSRLSVEQVDKATGSVAGIVSGARSIWDSIKGNEPSGKDATTYSGDANYTATAGGKEPTERTVSGTLKSIWDNIWATVKTTAEAGARGALEGSASASAGARQGATIGAQGASMNTTVLLAGALALVFILRK